MKTFFIGLLIFIIVWYLLKAVMRIVGIFVGTKANSNNTQQSRKGSVNIDYADAPKKHFGKESGEYVDFEEVK